MFGSETEGMPLRILEKHPEQCFTIPMTGPVRSLNLANAVSIVLYEALRQTGGIASQEPGVGQFIGYCSGLRLLTPPTILRRLEPVTHSKLNTRAPAC